MTRKSRRELERAVDDLAPTETDDEESLAIVFEDRETGEWYDDVGEDAEQVTEADLGAADPVMVIEKDVLKTDLEDDAA